MAGSRRGSGAPLLAVGAAHHLLRGVFARIYVAVSVFHGADSAFASICHHLRVAENIRVGGSGTSSGFRAVLGRSSRVLLVL